MHSVASHPSEILHDLRNFLLVVREAAREATHAFVRGDLRIDELQAIAESAGRAAELLERIEAPTGAPPLSVPMRCDLGHTARAAAFSLRHAAGKATLSVDAEDDCVVALDCLSLERILLNLVLNAREAGASRIAVEVAPTELDPHWIDGPLPPHAEAWVRLTVEDDGHGMTVEEAKQVTDSDFTTKPQGQGLGLTLVRKMVEDGGGVIQLGSEPDEGTRVVCILPVPEDEDELESSESEPLPS